MNKHIVKTASITVLGLLLALPAAAGHRNNGDFYDYARVVRVKPVYETVQVESGRQVCWNEPRTYHHGASHAPEIFGAIIGGVVGNQFGRGRGRGVATAAGALLGGAIAHDIKVRRGHGYGHNHTTVQERCRTEPVYHAEERLIGYRVKYRYHGKTYWTRTQENPGRHIRVSVGVRPAH